MTVFYMKRNTRPNRVKVKEINHHKKIMQKSVPVGFSSRPTRKFRFQSAISSRICSCEATIIYVEITISCSNQ